MAVHGHAPRGSPTVARGGRAPSLRPGPARRAGLKARGLAVWVAAGPGRTCEAVLARAAELVLARALKIAPEAEVHWPAAGAATSAAGSSRPGRAPAGRRHPAGRRRPLRRTSPEDDARRQHPPRRRRPAPSAGSPWTSPPARCCWTAAGAADRRRIQTAALPRGELSRAIGREELRLFLESFDSPGAATRSIDVYVGRVRRKLRGGRHADRHGPRRRLPVRPRPARHRARTRGILHLSSG